MSDDPVHNVHKSLLDTVGLTDITTLYGLPSNPREGDVEALAGVLHRLGQFEPILYAVEDHPAADEPVPVIQSGNHRHEAAIGLGWTHIAALDVTDLTPAQRKALALAMNRTAELGTFNDANLAQMIAELNELDDDLLDVAGYDLDDLEALYDELDSTPPEPGGAPGLLPGDLDDVDDSGYGDTYAVTVVLDSEEEQQALYERLTDEGLNCKVVTV